VAIEEDLMLKTSSACMQILWAIWSQACRQVIFTARLISSTQQSEHPGGASVSAPVGVRG
jgi:hypothetical protein